MLVPVFKLHRLFYRGTYEEPAPRGEGKRSMALRTEADSRVFDLNTEFGQQEVRLLARYNLREVARELDIRVSVIERVSRLSFRIGNMPLRVIS